MQNWLPLVLAAIFFVLLIAITAARAFVYGLTSQVFIVIAVLFYLFWLAYEWNTTKQEITQQRTPYDRGSLEIYALARGTTTIVAIATAGFNLDFIWVPLIGFVIFILGVALRLISIRTLGDLYSHRVRVKTQQGIVAHGPYRFIRHPAYAGMLVAHLGFLTITMSLWGFVVFAVMFLPAVIYRIKVEEAILTSQNPEYEKYCNGRARLIPHVW